jgi:hypothetical protein
MPFLTIEAVEAVASVHSGTLFPQLHQRSSSTAVKKDRSVPAFDRRNFVLQ